MTRSRLLIPLAAALAVMVLTGGIWWMTAASDNSGSETQPRSAAPDEPVGGGTAGNPGSGGGTDPGTEPGSGPGSGTPVEPAPGEDPAPGSVPIDSYYRRSPTTLALNYVIGVPECYGTVTGVEVRESADVVYVTLVHQPAKAAGDVACIDLAMLKSIDVTLAGPLGDRVVKDGAFEDKAVEQADAAYDEAGY